VKYILQCSCWLALVLLSSCGTYNQNIMFRTDSQRIPAGLSVSVAEAERNYIIQKNDYLDIRLYANRGERLIDLYVQQGNGAAAGNSMAAGQAGQSGPRFLVQNDGCVKLPMVGIIRLEQLTLQQADSVLERAFTPFYVDAFVTTRFANKRVFILGATQNQVVPLLNENMNLIEALALSGGVMPTARVRNIRLIRGDLSNPEVYLIDLSTIDGMTKSNLKLQANDIIYVEPVRKAWVESISDVTPILGLFSGIVSVITLVVFLSK
jgi:polysaccharide biosynthesis/export protein